MLFLFGNSFFTGTGTNAFSGGVNEHTIHGHLPGPPDGHSGDSHEHHGQHGHIAGPSSHEVFH